MQYQKINSQTFVIKIKRGERVIESLKRFCENQKIEGGFLYGIGAVDEVELAHYDVTTKKYSSKKFFQPFEVTNITGSIGIANNNLLIHAHITVTDTQMAALGGHLVEARISGTMEIHLSQTPKMEKFYDEETGLKLFHLENGI